MRANADRRARLAADGAWQLSWEPGLEQRPRLDGASFERHLGLDLHLDGYLFGATLAEVAALCRREGDGVFDRLRGGYVLVISDPEARRLLVARDAAGIVSCFHAWDGRRLRVSSHIDAVSDAGPDPVSVAESIVLGATIRPEATLREGVRRLLPAHRLRLDDRGLDVVRTWDPLPPDFEWATSDEAGRVVPLLQQAVGRCIDAGADSIGLSGGYDSVAIAAMSADLRGARAPIHAFSLVFPGTECDEAVTQRKVADALGMPQSRRSVAEGLDGRDCVQASLEACAFLPGPVVNLWYSIFTALLSEGRRLGRRGLLMGIGGDEMFNVDASHGADCLAGLDVAGLWRFTRAWQRTAAVNQARVARLLLWNSAAKPVLGRLVTEAWRRVAPRAFERLRIARLRRKMPEWLDAGMREELARRMAGAQAGGGRWDGWYVQALRRLLVSPLLLAELDQACAWSRAFGFRLFLPFYDRDLMALALRLRPDDLHSGGRSKGPLRSYVGQRLPEVGMTGAKVDYTAQADRMLRSTGRAAWERMGGARELVRLGIVSPGHVDSALNPYLLGYNLRRREAWQLLCAEQWLRTGWEQCDVGSA